MENFDFIEFQKTRDFSSKLNATFAFARQNGKSLMRALLYIAGPPILVASLLLSSFFGDFMKLVMGSATNPEALGNYFLTASFWAQVVAMMIFFVISYAAVISTTNNYMVLYAERKTNVIEVNDVWGRVRDTLGMYLSTMLLLGLLFVAVYVVAIIPVVVLGTMSPVLVFFGMVILVVGVVYVSVTLSLIFPIRAFEKKGFFESIVRSFYLIRSKWWSTFGLVLILSLLVSVISYIFSIPATILQMLTIFHSVGDESAQQEPGGAMGTAIFVLNSLSYISQLLLYFLLNIGLAFQFFNLVELKEAKGLMGQLENLGQSPPQPPREETY